MNKNIDELNKVLSKHFYKSRQSILSIGIAIDKEHHTYHYNKSAYTPLSFGLGSISKTFIGSYICELVDQRKIDLDQPVSDFIESNPKIRYPSIKDLLTHTSGYHGFIPLFSSMWILITSGFNKKNIYQHLDLKWLKNSLLRLKPLKKRKYRYSDYNYAVIALMIEVIEKKPFKDIMMTYIKEELGMKHTFYANRASTKDDRYSWLWEDDNPFLASGGLFSNIDDMMIYLNYQKKHQDKLKISHKKYHHTNLNKNIYTGFSWNAFLNGHFYWHIGGQGYYRSYVLFDTKKNISIAVLATVDVNIQHVSRLGSSLYRNIKRNPTLLFDFLLKYSNI